MSLDPISGPFAGPLIRLEDHGFDGSANILGRPALHPGVARIPYSVPVVVRVMVMPLDENLKQAGASRRRSPVNDIGHLLRSGNIPLNHHPPHGRR